MVKEKENVVKFTDTELEKIKDFQQRYLDIQMSFGQGEILRSRLERQLEEIDTFFDKNRDDLANVQKEERDFITEINKVYGDGVLNPETGVFTPSAQVPEVQQ